MIDRTVLTRRAAVTGMAGAAMLSSPALLRAATSVSELSEAALSLDQLHAIVLTQGGETVLADAPRGPGLDRAAPIKSVSKTLVALLAGIAIDRGKITGADAPVAQWFPGAAGTNDMTLAHLLSMTSGLESTSGRNYGAWVSSPNWARYALGRDRLAPPGDRFIYSTGSFHLAGIALSRATGDSLLALARGGIGRPLGIEIPSWVRDPQGFYLGGNEMALSPRALARAGQMVLNGGTWEGTQVVSESWLDSSFQPRARSPWSGDSYGLGWFLTRIAGTRAAYGRGYGGQILMVFPERDAVLAIMSDPARPARSGGYFSDLKRLAALAVGTLA